MQSRHSYLSKLGTSERRTCKSLLLRDSLGIKGQFPVLFSLDEFERITLSIITSPCSIFQLLAQSNSQNISRNFSMKCRKLIGARF